MTNIRRYFDKGNIYFLTHVTNNRLPILVRNFDLFWEALCSFGKDFEFEIIAWVVLPDHFHIIIDPEDADLSNLMRKIKLSFAANYRKRAGLNSGRVWQYRFWDHIIRNNEDMSRHIDYIHYNPVKHSLVRSPFEYPHSSIHKYFGEGYYDHDWGIKDDPSTEGNYGE